MKIMKGRKVNNMLRSPARWKSRPGGWDTLNIKRRKFRSSNSFGIPDIFPFYKKVNDPLKLLSYSRRDDRLIHYPNSICHFFVDDFRYESIWNRPSVSISRVRKFWATLTPDFSIFPNWPVIVQQWNTYRSRWIGRYWQAHGINVIPTVNWSNESSFDWCFISLPKQSVVSISVPDVRERRVSRRFEQGFNAMIERLEPIQVIVYGTMPFNSDVCIEFTPDWESLRPPKEDVSKVSNGLKIV